MFPSEGYFFLKSQKTGLVLDINGENKVQIINLKEKGATNNL